MRTAKYIMNRCRHSTPTLALALLCALLSVVRPLAQTSPRQGDSPEVAIRVLSAEVVTFPRPIRLGPPRRATEYREALVLKVEVDKAVYDSLPPSMEPFLYIGREEYRIFSEERKEGQRNVVLTFHVRNWERLTDASPMVLTIDHGAPPRDLERFNQRTRPRFNKSMITDRRQAR